MKRSMDGDTKPFLSSSSSWSFITSVVSDLQQSKSRSTGSSSVKRRGLWQVPSHHQHRHSREGEKRDGTEGESIESQRSAGKRMEME